MSQQRRDAFVSQAQEIISLAWKVNGESGLPLNSIEAELRTLNGLLAIALAEFTYRTNQSGAVPLRVAMLEDRNA